MVDTALSDSFDLFMRKIGYSVGLEDTFKRLRDFSELYASVKTITFGDINRLVHNTDCWGLKNDHILDVLRSLNVLMVRRDDVAVLEAGDALGICRRVVEGDQFDRCLQFIFASSIIQSDGDIFLNALAARFDPGEFERALVAMVEHKRNVLEKSFKSPAHRKLMYDAINIEAQVTNPGSRGGVRISGNKQGGPLLGIGRKGPFENLTPGYTKRPNVEISGDYIRKTLPKRKGWAISLGLATSDGQITDGGERLLMRFKNAGFSGPNAMAMWPLASEVNRTRFARVEYDAPKISAWDFYLLVDDALGVSKGAASYSANAHEEAIVQLSRIFSEYRNLNHAKRMIRNQLPIRIAFMAEVALARGLNRPTLPLPEVVQKEQDVYNPRVLERRSRLAEATLAFR